jgi:hypothetical protein
LLCQPLLRGRQLLLGQPLLWGRQLMLHLPLVRQLCLLPALREMQQTPCRRWLRKHGCCWPYSGCWWRRTVSCCRCCFRLLCLLPRLPQPQVHHQAEAPAFEQVLKLWQVHALQHLIIRLLSLFL